MKISDVTFIHSDDPAVHSQLSVQIRRDMQVNYVWLSHAQRMRLHKHHS